MQKREINNNIVSLLGMGCMRLPVVPQTNEIDFNKTEEMIKYAMDHGITYYDTAYPYHNGQSELVIGKILSKYPRNSFYLASKMPSWDLKTIEDAKRIFNHQLEKCKVEYFDFYLCHAMNMSHHETYKRLGVYQYLLELKKEGKIKNLGFSYHDAPQNIIPIADELDWDFAQIQFNYLDYEMQDAKLQYEELTKRGISVVVMEPVRGGVLANVTPKAEELFKEKEPKLSIASWALRYVAHFPNIKVILSGMSNLEQLTDNINTFTNYKPLSDDDLETIVKAKKLILGNDFIPCTGCRYCMPCPVGVNIPRIFSLFNNYGIHKDIEKLRNQILKLEEKELPKNCIKCGKCVKKCPQGIKIYEQLEKINNIISK